MKGRLLDAVPLSSLTGVGAALSNKLAKINLHTVQDLLLHLPPALRRSHPSLPHRRTTAGRLCHGGRRSAELQYLLRRSADDDLPDQRRFRHPHHALFQFQRGNEKIARRRAADVLAYGEAKRGKYGAEMIHPEYRVQGDLSTPELQETLTPVYPTTEGVKQATLRKLTDQGAGSARHLRH